MAAAVIDTNVLLVANGAHDDVSADCRKACIERLLRHQKTGVTVIDDGFRILGEYLHKTNPSRPRGVGDAFLKWLLQNRRNPARVQEVTVTETGPDRFAEFPGTDLQDRFDPSDRKFAAVALAHPERPALWQAADCKWLDWWPALQAAGVRVDFLCPGDACRFYQAKFPERPPPRIPMP